MSAPFRRVAWLAAALALVFASAATRAVAQDSARGEARRLFDQGVALLEGQQFAEAALLLERSLALRETPPVLYDLGLAYRGAGRYPRAINAFERFVVAAGDDTRFAGMRAGLGPVLEELRASLATVRVQVRGGATEVRLDDEIVARSDGAYVLAVDPGRHVVEASRRGGTPVQREIDVLRGASASAELVVPRAVLAGPSSERGDALRTSAAADDGALTGKWWFWTGLGVLVLGGVVATVAAWPRDAPYEDGSLGFTAEALSPR